jgi:hypothetical protein
MSRDHLSSTSAARWLHLIRGEYLEIPGLHLTKPEIQRLWGLDTVTCDAVIDTLETTGFLRRSRDGGYVRADGGPSSAAATTRP